MPFRLTKLKGLTRQQDKKTAVESIQIFRRFTSPPNLCKRYWGDNALNEGRFVWFNRNGCESRADREIVSRDGESGTVLYIQNPSMRRKERIGAMSQTIPCQKGVTYQLSARIKGRSLEENAFAIRIAAGGETTSLSIPDGTWDWQTFELTFPSTSAALTLEIITEDRGEAWIDDITLNRIRNDPVKERGRQPSLGPAPSKIGAN